MESPKFWGDGHLPSHPRVMAHKITVDIAMSHFKRGAPLYQVTAQ